MLTKTNTEIIIEIDGNPTTGYIVRPSYFDKKLLMYESEKYVPSSDRMGSNGKYIFKFKIINRINTKVFFERLRPWDILTRSNIEIPIIY